MPDAVVAPPADLLAAARAWAADDPDAVTRAELEGLVAAAEAGDAAAAAELADAMSGMLEFGTAGLRGRLGGGPNRMNRAVVIRAAAGLTAYLETLDPEPFVVVGFDARTNSDVFAHDTCAVVVGTGGRAVVLPHPLPTPVLAYAVRYLGADAGVMVTASHNPPEDNGYKVYVGDGSQIVSPVDGLIAAEIAKVTSVASVPMADDGWETLDDSVLEAYLADVRTVVADDSPREVTVVHTALHGVGTETVRRAFVAAGYPAPIPVTSQAEPDPMFPTVSFPNPEEPGAMDAALELAEQTSPDVVIANDPDADRCAVAVPGPGGWRMLRGDEVGALLGSHVLSRGAAGGVLPDSPDCVFASSIVSSRLLAAICRTAGVRHEETLTGFKWIGRVPGLRYGYEEALGYCVDPARVRDKDGVSAALLVAELVATLRAEGRSLTDRLDDLAREHGVYATDAFSVRVEDLSLIAAILDRLRADPAHLGGRGRRGAGRRPGPGGRRAAAHRGAALLPGRRLPGHRPAVRHRAEAQGLPRGRRAGHRRRPAGARRRAATRLAGIRTDLEAATSPDPPAR